MIQTFNFQEKSLMTLTHPVFGILFDATNVCEILEYARSANNVLEKLDDDEKFLLKREEYETFPDPKPDLGSEFDSTFSVGSKNQGRGGYQSKWFITEEGLYHMIMGSKKLLAKNFPTLGLP